MISGFQPIDLGLLAAAKAAYGNCTFDSDLAHWLLIEDDEKLIIAARGTIISSLRDLYVDASDGKTYAQGIGTVHAGFFRSATSVAYAALPRALKAKAAGKKLLMTGHSKGGAEAAEGALLFASVGLHCDRVTLWEPARALSAEAAQKLAPMLGVCTRNGSDMVTEWGGAPSWMAPYPLAQLGDPAFEFDWVPYHKLDNVELAVAKAILAGGPG